MLNYFRHILKHGGAKIVPPNISYNKQNRTPFNTVTWIDSAFETQNLNPHQNIELI